MSKLSWTILLVISMAGIATFYPIAKYLNGAIDPYLLAFLRFFVATLALLPFMSRRHSLRLPPRSEWPFFLMLAFFVVIPTALIVIGIEKTNTIVSAILINTNPLFIALLAPFLIGELMTRRKITALAIGFIGVVFVVLNGQDFRTLFNSSSVIGSAVLMIGALLSALYAICARDFVRKYDGLYVTFFSVALGSGILALIVAFRDGFAQVLNLTPTDLLSVLAIGVVCTAIPWVIWGSSLKHLEVNVAASFKLLIPVFATLYSFAFFQEPFTSWTLLGLVLTSTGIYIVQREDVRTAEAL